MYNGSRVRLVDVFKYLGVMFCRDGSLKEMIKHRIAQGRRVLAAWRRRSAVWMLDAKLRERLFKVCVMPAFEYSVNIWGSVDFASTLWKQVEVYILDGSCTFYLRSACAYTHRCSIWGLGLVCF